LVLTSGSGATRQRAPHTTGATRQRAPQTTGAYAETTQEPRASEYPKQNESYNSSSSIIIDPKSEDYPELWREAVQDAERRKRNGVDIHSIDAYAMPRFRDLVAERQQQETEREAAERAQSAIDACGHCDHLGLRWSLPDDGAPATRDTPGAVSDRDRCDHADAGDVVVPIEAAAR
jgi:hypothetical protein